MNQNMLYGTNMGGYNQNMGVMPNNGMNMVNYP
jgi:hypothetical protein